MISLCALLLASPLFSDDSNSTVFSAIYDRGEWGVGSDQKGNSGGGSDPRNAFIYIAYLQNFLAEHEIKSVVDLGCGDWRLGNSICWDGIDYLGVDVVDSIIESNIKNYTTANISFVKADGISFTLPQADLLICKDVLQHLPNKDIRAISRQFKKFKYCLLVNDVNPTDLTSTNVNIPRGHSRTLDMSKPPFSFAGRKVLTYTSQEATKQVFLIQSF